MVRTPSTEQRVVLGFTLTADTFWPINTFNNVLFPTFGLPQSPTERLRFPL